MAPRPHIRARTQIAALLCQLRDAEGNYLIPYDHAQKMTEDQVISLFHRDHYPIPKAHGGPDAHWNIVFRLRADHKEKTAKVDQPQIAKTARLEKAHAEHLQSVRSGITRAMTKRKIPSRPLRSRNRLPHRKPKGARK